MSRRLRVDRDEDEEDSWDEGEDDIETVPCPHCHATIAEGADWCPQCERHVDDDPPLKPDWVRFAALLALIGFGFSAVGYFVLMIFR